jgi:hypothetical protein
VPRFKFRFDGSNSHASSFSRRRARWAFSFSPLFEGRRNAERRTLVTAAAYFPDCRETEAHGNASQRPAAATSSTLGPTLPAQARASSPSRQAFAHPSPVPPSHLRQSPVVGSGGYPRPPGSTLARHGRGRRIRPVRVTLPGQAFALSHFSNASRSAPHWTGREQDKRGLKGGDKYPRESMQI